MPHSLEAHLNQIVYLKSIKSLLSWDQETLMPLESSPFNRRFPTKNPKKPP
jgi:Zn-dependent M32 family carboxypeptidase